MQTRLSRLAPIVELLHSRLHNVTFSTNAALAAAAVSSSQRNALNPQSAKESSKATLKLKKKKRANSKPREKKHTRATHQLGSNGPFTSKWTGLSATRLRKLRDKTAELSEIDVHNSSINALMASILETQHMSMVANTFRAMAHTNQSDIPFTLTSNTIHLIVQSCMKSAVQDDRIAALSSNAADTAVEVVFRLIHSFDIRPDIQIFRTIVRAAAEDPVFERRSERIWSVLRYARAAQLVPSLDFIYDCFSTLIGAVDVEGAAALMEFALRKEMYDDSGRGHGPRQIDYYNGVMYAAWLMSQFSVIDAAYAELKRIGLHPNHSTQCTLLAATVDTGDEEAAERIFNAIQSSGKPVTSFVFAALIRAAGEKGNVESVLENFKRFETHLREHQISFRDTLSAPSLSSRAAYGEHSVREMATGRADPTMALFRALRACKRSSEATEMLATLKSRYDFVPSPVLYSIVIETCWRAGKVELAKSLRLEMQTHRT